MRDMLYCGAARACITPPDELIPDLYALMGGRFGGVHDDIFVRCISLKSGEDRALLVCWDLDKAPYPKAWIEELSALLGIPEVNILYAAIHTHTAPITDPRPDDGPNAKAKQDAATVKATAEYEDLIHASLLRAAKAAENSMRPARMGYRCGKSYINVNRNFPYREDGKNQLREGHNGAAEPDRTLFLARFDDLSGNPIALIENYAVHNVTMFRNGIFDGRNAISADLGGNVSQKLERDYPGCVAMWTSGAAGDVNPVMMDVTYYPDAETGAFTEELMPGDRTFPLRVLLARHAEDVRNTLAGLQCTAETAPVRCAEEEIRTPGRSGDYRLRMHAVRIGEVVFIGFSGELYTSFGRQVREACPYRMPLIVNHDASFLHNSGYILDDPAIAGDALGNSHSNLQPGYLAGALAEASARLFEKIR